MCALCLLHHTQAVPHIPGAISTLHVAGSGIYIASTFYRTLRCEAKYETGFCNYTPPLSPALLAHIETTYGAMATCGAARGGYVGGTREGLLPCAPCQTANKDIREGADSRALLLTEPPV